MKLRCSCGRDVETTGDETTGTVVCPDCGRRIEPDTGPRTTPLPPPPPGARRTASARTPALVIVMVVLVIVLMAIACAGLFAALFVPALNQATAQSDRARCSENLRLIGSSLFMYATENKDYFPPLPAEPGRLMFAPESVYPEYLENPWVFVCESTEMPEEEPALQALIDDTSYVYLSHALLDDAQGRAFAAAYRKRMAEGLPMDEDIAVDPGDDDRPSAGQLKRLQLGVERVLARDPLDRAELDRLLARIPVLVEWPNHHDRPGGNVMFLDGHVEFVPYPGPFPMTEQFIATLERLDEPRAQ